jgi:hypothetical protein
LAQPGKRCIGGAIIDEQNLELGNVNTQRVIDRFEESVDGTLLIHDRYHER